MWAISYSNNSGCRGGARPKKFEGAAAVKLVAPSKLIRKVLSFPVQSGSQDSGSGSRRQSKSDQTFVQICGQVCKNDGWPRRRSPFHPINAIPAALRQSTSLRYTQLMGILWRLLRLPRNCTRGAEGGIKER